jgi:hypothetical protein
MASKSIRENFGYLMQSKTVDVMGVFLMVRQGRGQVTCLPPKGGSS